MLNKNKVYRILDANFNRAKEGLRVCEDVCRFIIDDKAATKRYKQIRHQLTKAVKVLGIKEVVGARDIDGDVGRSSILTELKRSSIEDVFYANSQRIKESIRVLEEFAKLLNRRFAVELKALRYQIYALEKKIVGRL